MQQKQFMQRLGRWPICLQNCAPFWVIPSGPSFASLILHKSVDFRVHYTQILHFSFFYVHF